MGRLTGHPVSLLRHLMYHLTPFMRGRCRSPLPLPSFACPTPASPRRGGHLQPQGALAARLAHTMGGAAAHASGAPDVPGVAAGHEQTSWAGLGEGLQGPSALIPPLLLFTHHHHRYSGARQILPLPSTRIIIIISCRRPLARFHSITLHNFPLTPSSARATTSGTFRRYRRRRWT